MNRALVLGSALAVLLTFEAEAFAQTAAAAPSPDAPPAPTSPATLEPTAPASTDVAGSTASTPKEGRPADLAAIPGTDERHYIRSPAMKKMMARTTTWDLNLELGYGRIFPSPPHWEGFFRGGAGIMFVRDPFYEILRFTYEYSPRSNATLGVELEADWVETGLWGNIGLMKDANSVYWGGRASLGWAIFGFEAEYRGDATTKTYAALYGKLRLPLGIIGRALQ